MCVCVCESSGRSSLWMSEAMWTGMRTRSAAGPHRIGRDYAALRGREKV